MIRKRVVEGGRGERNKLARELGLSRQRVAQIVNSFNRPRTGF